MKKEIILMISNDKENDTSKKQGIRLINSFLDGVDSINYMKDVNTSCHLISITNTLNDIIKLVNSDVKYCIEEEMDLFYIDVRKFKQIVLIILSLLQNCNIYIHFTHESSKMYCNLIFSDFFIDEIVLKYIFKPFYSLNIDLLQMRRNDETELRDILPSLEKWRLVYLITQTIKGDIYFQSNNLYLSIPIKETDQNIDSHTTKILKGKKAIIMKNLLERAKLDNYMKLYICENFNDANMLYSELTPDFVIIDGTLLDITETNKTIESNSYSDETKWNLIWNNSKIIVFNQNEDALQLKYKLLNNDIEE